ncbi:hypothetical protein GOP47_0012713 [Adiantum capillus-veneris]|uniref:Protein Mpv17 n=1 Tax=Adiantum capillus-veneris TaxID=13818 RepID=A0A9D4ZFY8_ADICA|nr:hypothetical protein GOP47_0012713 [Adiantum capillus-veneris]
MAAVPLHGVWGWYKQQLAVSPLRTQLLSSSLIWAVGDVLAQFISFKHTQSTLSLSSKQGTTIKAEAFDIDWKRVLTLSFFGAAFVAPVGHWWYESLEYVVTKQLKFQASSLKSTSTKLIADTFLLGPLHLLAFLTYMGAASGKTMEEIKVMLKRDYIPALVTEGAFWPLVQAFNFRFVPVKHQLLYVNGFCLVDSVFLSWFKFQEDAAWKRWLLSHVAPKHQ